jgi:putative transposase
MVDLVRSGRTPEELAREFEPTAQSISTWVKQADRDAGKRIDGPTSAELENWGAFDVRTIACVRSATSWQRRQPGSRGERGEPERVYGFISAHQAMYPIRTMARVLKVSASGYYAWRSRPASARATADADLTRHIRTIHAGSHGTYGAPRVHAELTADGLSVGRKRIARLMRAAGIAGVSRRRSAPIKECQESCVRGRG